MVTETDYTSLEKGEYSGYLCFTDYSYSSANEILNNHNGANYHYRMKSQYLLNDVVLKDDSKAATFLWVGIVIFSVMILIEYIFINSMLKNSFIFTLRKKGMTDSSAKKVVLFTFISLFILAFVLSIVGIYTGCLILNVTSNYIPYGNGSFHHYGIYGYLISIGIIAVLFLLAFGLTKLFVKRTISK